MKTSIHVTINPYSDAFCGIKCPMLRVERLGTIHRCAIFATDGESEMAIDESMMGSNRHADCIKAERAAKRKARKDGDE